MEVSAARSHVHTARSMPTEGGGCLMFCLPDAHPTLASHDAAFLGGRSHFSGCGGASIPRGLGDAARTAIRSAIVGNLRCSEEPPLEELGAALRV